MKTALLLVTMFCLFGSIYSRAETLSYYTDGCAEYFIHQGDSDPNHSPKWRIVYRCCGSSCVVSTDWTDQVGPMNLCGTMIYPPSGGGSGQLAYDWQGNVIVTVPSGHGGIVSFNPSVNCHPFIPDGSSTVTFPRQMF